MTVYKNTNSDYTITVDGGSGTLTINADLDVVGNITYIDSTELQVQDPFITLNNSNTGSYMANSGVLTHTAASTYAGIRYNRTALQWELSDSTDATGTSGTWSVIASGGAGTPGLPNASVQFNDSGTFAGSTNLVYDSGTDTLTLTGTEVYGNIGSTPAYSGNGVAVYNKAIGSGGTGLYVKNSTVDDELVSKSAAIVYSIIF